MEEEDKHLLKKEKPRQTFGCGFSGFDEIDGIYFSK